VSVDEAAATLDNLQYVIIGVVVALTSGHDHGNTCMGCQEAMCACVYVAGGKGATQQDARAPL
jgi:hypothetical protein